MRQPLCDTEWEILTELRDGTLKWGAAVGACWKNLVAHGYTERDFGGITDKGKEALMEREGYGG